MRTQTLDQKFTENINPIMMAVNNMQNARFMQDWAGVEKYRLEIAGYLDAIKEVCDAELGQLSG
jgi:hypothetical protein